MKKMTMASLRHLFTTQQPALMMGAGIAGVATTIVLAVRGHSKAVKKMEEVIKEAKEKGTLDTVLYYNKKNVEKTRKKVYLKHTYKYYIPATIVGSLSVSCLIGSYSINHKRNAALASSLALSEAAMTEYQKVVVDSIGESAEKEIRDKFNKKQIEKIEAQKPMLNQSEYLRDGKTVKCYESTTQQSFWSSKEDIKKAINDLNQERLTGIGTEVTLNEFYAKIGIVSTSIGDSIGWDVQNPVDIDFSTIEVDGIPCLYIRPLNLVSLMYGNLRRAY